MSEVAERFGKLVVDQYVVRDRDEIARFLDGLDLVEPGLVPIEQWWPPATVAAPAPDPDVRAVPIYGALARKP
jgi:hypothetical protein